MKAKALLPLLALPLMWGAYYVASQQTVAGLSTLTAGVVIRLVCLVLLLGVMGLRGQLRLLARVKYVWPRLCLIGLLGFLLDLTAFIGLSLSGAGTGVALLKCDIIFVNLISILIYKERFTTADWGFSLLMLAGVFLVLGAGLGDLMHVFSGGGIFFILSALFVSVNAFVIKSVQHDTRNPMADNVVAFYNNGITLLLFLVAAAATGSLGTLARLGEGGGLLAAALLAGLGQTLVYLLYYFNLRRWPVWLVKVVLLLMPPVSAGISFLLFGEGMDARQLTGVAALLAGACGILFTQRHKQAIRTDG